MRLGEWTKHIVCLAVCLMASQAAFGRERAVFRLSDAALELVAFSELRSWADDDLLGSFTAFQRSCRPILAGSSSRDKRPMAAALREVCRQARQEKIVSVDAARGFFERHFRPIRIATLSETAGFLTGYYEPIVEGSRFPTGYFTVPMYRRPSDAIVLDRKKGEKGFSNKAKVGMRVGKGKIVPYHDRAAIEDGALVGRRLELCWLKDPVDKFFIQIQGSARVQLEDGTTLRLNYDGHNGHRYTPIGRILIERQALTREEMSMDRLRQWMQADPEAGRELRRENKSYVFFRITGLSDNQEAVGAQGVPLTKQRSIAVDRALHVYGTPFFIDADLPLENASAATPFSRLTIAQDTGSAIVGPARADIYFGAGAEAGSISGRLRHKGQFFMLVPRAIDPALIARTTPLPPRKAALAAEPAKP